MAPMNQTRRRKFWGWGFEGEGLDVLAQKALYKRLAESYGLADLALPAVPRVEEFELPAARLRPPSALESLLTDDAYERLLHAYGRSYADAVRLVRRQSSHPPDWVAYPRQEEDVTRLLEWIGDVGAAAIPFGGGSSVCGGVEPDVGEDYTGAVTIDLKHLDRVIEIDKTSRAARIQAGVRGPDLESQLKPHGLTLRHFPQSFEHSTLGGWIATRSGGHYASLYTHIDDFVESVRMLTPTGLWESRRLPGSGAGPSPDRWAIGSEGTLGVITEAWMRLQDRPRYRDSRAVLFSDFLTGAEAVRALSQSGLFPTNCRLIDAEEARNAGAGEGGQALLVLGFESADHPLGPWMARALELVRDHGGRVDEPVESEGSHRQGAAGQWRDAFLRAPYLRELMVPAGVIADTFETAIPWARFGELYQGVVERMTRVLEEICGGPTSLTCRFTHVYPDGPAPYFTFQAYGGEKQLEKWREIKRAANRACIELGGTVTHHHAVGRDHRHGGYDEQRPEPFARALAGAKSAIDPQGILNPGVLIDVTERQATARGVLG